MRTYTTGLGGLLLVALILAGCSDSGIISGPDVNSSIQESDGLVAAKGVLVVNGWYEGEEIYYIDHGVEEGVAERGENDIFLIGGARLYQANVVEFIPGEPGYSPHWNVNVVHTAEGVTVADIVAAGFASDHYPDGPLFDDVEDILGAWDAGLVTIDKPGVVVLCPVVSEKVADAPGNIEAPEDFPPFPETF